jgi:CheY-like chemotaxis protein
MSATEESRKTILLVDDFRDFVLATRIFLESEGYDVVEAYDGIQALELLARQRPDLIILDVMMPRLDGWATLTRIQEDTQLQDIPVLMLTALREPANIKTGIDLGCTWYYAKPVTDYHDFALVIRRILSALDLPPEA